MLEIRFGEGGTDSKMFVSDLYDAYCKYAQSLGLKVKELYLGDGHIIMNIRGSGAGKAFQHEAGKHTVQRVPPTEHKGRRHTSIVSVAVLPMKPNVERDLNMQDVEIMTTKGTGPGGQHKNKTESAVRVKHKPTGITVFIDGRNQHQNKREALRILATRVNEQRQQGVDKTYDKERRKQLGGGGRSNKIRTYNFIRDQVVDHRLGVKLKRVEEVIGRGRFDLIFKKVKD